LGRLFSSCAAGLSTGFAHRSETDLSNLGLSRRRNPAGHFGLSPDLIVPPHIFSLAFRTEPYTGFQIRRIPALDYRYKVDTVHSRIFADGDRKSGV
jgi:hypothetical protein